MNSMFKFLSPYKYLIIAGIVASVLGYIYTLKSDIKSTEQKLKAADATIVVRDERIKALDADISTLKTSRDIEQESYRISQDSIAELKALLDKKPTENTVYVTEYIKNPNIPKCIISAEWVRAYQGIRANPYLTVPERKD